MNALRNLPKVDKIISLKLFKNLNKTIVTQISRQQIEILREQIKTGQINSIDEEKLINDILNEYKQKTTSSLKPLINATGVILHTNLGRAVLSEEIFLNTKDIACSYSNLEFDTQTGKRGQRYTHVSKLFKVLLNCEDVLVVNNNAAAVYLVLNTFAKNKQVIVSRGELVEIGGSFRVSEVMKQSGAKLKEVGTTNKTKLSDYENAISTKTAMLLKVHKSNFVIKGFSEEVSPHDLINLSKKYNLIDYYDVGGAYLDGFHDDELDLRKILKSNPSLVSFSGDKLFGSIQAGIIVGKSKLIKQLKQNQLLRMFRVDKITLSLLEASLQAYLKQDFKQIPTLQLIQRSEQELRNMALSVSKDLPKDSHEIINTTTFVGGGTMPDKTFSSIALHIKGDAKKLQKKFRESGVVGRIENEKFLLDFKSILKKDLNLLKSILKELS